jgi:hypothetical protein
MSKIGGYSYSTFLNRQANIYLKMVDASTQTKQKKHKGLLLHHRSRLRLSSRDDGHKLRRKTDQQLLQTRLQRNIRRQLRKIFKKGPLQKCAFHNCLQQKHTNKKGGWLCFWHDLTPTRAAKVGVHKMDNMVGTRIVRAIRQPDPLGWSLFAYVDILPNQYITTYEG